jgi:hypothetical protein
MRLRALRTFLLPLLFAITLAPAFANCWGTLHCRGERLDSMVMRVLELYQASKYNEAIPLAEQYVAATAEDYGENASEYATALHNLALALQAMSRFSEAEPLMTQALTVGK